MQNKKERKTLCFEIHNKYIAGSLVGNLISYINYQSVMHYFSSLKERERIMWSDDSKCRRVQYKYAYASPYLYSRVRMNDSTYRYTRIEWIEELTLAHHTVKYQMASAEIQTQKRTVDISLATWKSPRATTHKNKRVCEVWQRERIKDFL